MSETSDTEAALPPTDVLGVLCFGYLVLLGSVVVVVWEMIAVAASDEVALIGGAVRLSGFVPLVVLLTGSAGMLGLYQRRRWGWFGTIATFGIWAPYTAVLGKPFVAGGALVCVLYLLYRVEFYLLLVAGLGDS